MFKKLLDIFNTEKIAQIVKEAVVSDLKKEFELFKIEIKEQLDGFNLAINSIDNRMNSIENRITNIENKIDRLNEKIDKVKDEIDTKINNIRIELIKIINDSREDLLIRTQKIESKLGENYINEIANIIKFYEQTKKDK